MFNADTVSRGCTRDALRRAVPQAWKNAVASVICSRPVGDVIRRVFRDRIPHQGHRILVENADVVSSQMVANIFFGIYERAEIDLVRRFLPKHLDVVELGASLGVNTCTIARNTATQRMVIGVEADPVLCAMATRTLALNGYGDRVTLVNAAIDYSGQDQVIMRRGADNLSGSLSDDGTFRSTYKVVAVTLGRLLTQHHLGDYSLVADIEGAEVAILLADRKALERCRAIIIEIEDGSHAGQFLTRKEIRELIADLGFLLQYQYGPCAAFARR
jgi:FkbM family methyltransferase